MSAINYCRGRSITDSQPEPRMAQAFPALLDALERDRTPRKTGAGYFCGPLGGTGRRCAEGALPRRWIALDIDRAQPNRLTELHVWMSRHSAGSWPTHSSTAEVPRLRVLIELDREANRRECISLGAALSRELAAEFGDDVALDECTFRGEQPIFLPPEGVRLERFGGEPLRVDDYLGAGMREPEATLQKGTEGPQVTSVPSVPSVPSVKLERARWWPGDWMDWPGDAMPDGPGQRRGCLFALARRLRAVNRQMSLQDLVEVARDWHATFESVIRTKDLGLTVGELQQAYADVKTPHGAVLADALGEATKHVIARAELLPDHYGTVTHHLVRLCAVLQRRSGDKPFFLDCRTAGSALNVSHTEASQLLRMMRRDGVLELVQEGTRGRASRYRYVWSPPLESASDEAFPATRQARRAAMAPQRPRCDE